MALDDQKTKRLNRQRQSQGRELFRPRETVVAAQGDNYPDLARRHRRDVTRLIQENKERPIRPGQVINLPAAAAQEEARRGARPNRMRAAAQEEERRTGYTPRTTWQGPLFSSQSPVGQFLQSAQRGFNIRTSSQPGWQSPVSVTAPRQFPQQLPNGEWVVSTGRQLQFNPQQQGLLGGQLQNVAQEYSQVFSRQTGPTPGVPGAPAGTVGLGAQTQRTSGPGLTNPAEREAVYNIQQNYNVPGRRGGTNTPEEYRGLHYTDPATGRIIPPMAGRAAYIYQLLNRGEMPKLILGSAQEVLTQAGYNFTDERLTEMGYLKDEWGNWVLSDIGLPSSDYARGYGYNNAGYGGYGGGGGGGGGRGSGSYTQPGAGQRTGRPSVEAGGRVRNIGDFGLTRWRGV